MAVLRQKLITFLIFLCVFTALAFYLKNGLYSHDDFAMSFFYGQNLWQTIIGADHGRYLSSVTMKFVADTLSQIQHVHPQDNFIGFMLKGLNFTVLFYFMAKLFNFDKKGSRLTDPIAFIIVSVFSVAIVSNRDFLTLNCYNQNFGYIFNLIFFVPALLLVCDLFVNKKLPNKSEMVKSCILFSLLGFSAHFNIVTFSGFIIVIFMYLFFKNIKNLKSLFEKVFSKPIILPLLCFISAALLSFTSYSFRYLLFEVRRPQGAPWLSSVIASVPDFTQQWVFALFSNGKICVLVLLLTVWAMILIKRTGSIEKYRNIFLAWALIYGAAFFNYTLIICSTTFHGNGGQYWLVSPEVRLVTDIYFIMALIIISGIVFELTDKKKLFVFICAFVSLTMFIESLPALIYNYHLNTVKRRTLYEVEKETLFLQKLNRTDCVYFPERTPLPDWVIDIDAFENNFYNNYNIHTIKKYKYITEKEFIKLMESKGLKFSKEELNTPKFSILKEEFK